MVKGKSYITSKDALNRLEKEVLVKDRIYSHVFIMIGNNEGRLVAFNKPKFTVQEFIANMQELIKRIKENGRTVIICNLQPLDNKDIFRIHPAMPKFLKPPATPYDWHKQYSDACKEIAEINGLHFIDIRSELEKEKKSGREVIADYCLDPNELGHRLMAETICNDLRKFYNLEA